MLSKLKIVIYISPKILLSFFKSERLQICFQTFFSCPSPTPICFIHNIGRSMQNKKGSDFLILLKRKSVRPLIAIFIFLISLLLFVH